MAEENSLDAQLWHACAGSMVQIPPVNSRVIYFAQGHLEHAQADLDLTSSPRIPPFIPCRIVDIKFRAESETDEVYARLKLLPTVEDDGEIDDLIEMQDKPASFAKTLTQSDANNGGGFSVPRYCAETIFPRLDYSSDPPVQTVVAKDVHGEVWKFRHIYRGTPRRHLLTTGWSTFVNQKKLVAGDSIVFLRSENGELCVGIRRTKRPASGWNTGSGSYVRCGGRGRARAENVLEAASLAANGRPFEVLYYPRASTPEFFVKTEAVRSAMRVTWCSGMRFKMPFETEDSSRISWFMGTISSVHVADPVRWPHSPWRLLQVSWDEPDLLQNVKRVNPWLVELVSTGSVIPLPAFPPARKKLRFPPEKWLVPAISGGRGMYGQNTNSPVSIQGARHGFSLPDLGFYHKFQSGPVNGSGFTDCDENLSCFLTIGSSSSKTEQQPDETKLKLKPRFLLFGQPILTAQQLGDSGGLPVQDVRPDPGNNPSGLGEAHCKVFMESEDLGRSLDLSVLGSYEELHRSLANMFGLETPQALSRVRYQDATGSIRNTGDEPFCDFMRTAKKLTIMTDSGSGNVDDAWIDGPWKSRNGLDSARKRGPLGIFA